VSTIDAALGELAAELRAGIPVSVERGLAQMREELPEFFVRDRDPDFVDVYRRSYADQLRLVCDGLAGGRDVRRLDVPGDTVAETRMSAGFGIRLGPFLRGYRISHRLLLDDAIAAAGRRIADERLREAVLLRTSAWLFAYFDWVMARMTEVYEEERELLVRDRERRKGRLVRDLLDGRAVEAGELGYDLEQEHVGLVAWGADPERGLAAVGDVTGLALLTVASTESAAWGWLGARSIDAAALRGAPAPPAGLRLAVGDPARGPDGFRRTHRQALDAYRIARDASEPAVTWHADVALLALTLQDPAAAREFVLRELGPLAGPDARSALLRETLAAYFASGLNATAAAAALGVHERTARYRLRTIEQRLGRPLRERRDELAVALRLAPLVLAGSGK
jgi:hypothetical protein